MLVATLYVLDLLLWPNHLTARRLVVVLLCARSCFAVCVTCAHTCIQLYRHMQARGIDPTVATFGTLITIASEAQAYDRCVRCVSGIVRHDCAWVLGGRDGAAVGDIRKTCLSQTLLYPLRCDA